jgi:hypothetical protein
MDILAFDPGKTTGYCRLKVSGDGTEFAIVEAQEISWLERLPTLFNIIASAESGSNVVIEAFRLFPHKASAQIGSDFPSSQVIGTIETFCFISHERLTIEYQQPGDISRVQVLERDLPHVAGSPHKIDAYRHARLYFLRHYLSNPFSSRPSGD